MKVNHKKPARWIAAFVFGLLTQAQPATSAEAVVYKQVGDVTLTLKAFVPDTARFPGPHPAVVFFFGGGWRQGSMTQFEPFAEHYAGLGMVAFTVDYRVASRHGVTPIECIADARSAMRWVRAHAAEYNVDPSRIAASGGSAGGHLAATTALISAFDESTEDSKLSAEPNALVLFNPALNMERIRDRIDLGENHLKASPQHQLANPLPPTLILHGDQDDVVPISEAREFAREAQRLGYRCELEEYPGQGHGFFNVRNPEMYKATVERADTFYRSLGWIQ